MSAAGAVLAGFTTAGRRLLGRRALVAVVLGVALTATSAVIERSTAPAGATDRALTATFRLVIPLVAFALTADAADRARLRDAAWPAARFGLGRGGVALGMVLAAVMGAAAVSGLVAVLAVLAAHGPGSPPLARDALVSSYVGALAGAAYGGWFSLGSTFLRRGRGRVVPLALDLLFGGSAGVLGAMLPRSHATNLIGGEAPLGLAQQGSAGILVGMALVLGLLAAFRTRD
ncbi:hypothetical protein [Chondromyces apiculatus]|uniref:Uncharacterized protein n=1 Tax=Chondromyces apiculatus DSM 436 TaxID=1192034 RepID=A0A017T2J6_9BACT|nr:hypothetical protein [Chondromyces apiculatus]EYF03484.1 Hypothetical protein CAP_5468 [Chondromyces apiculatus DSM 436]